MCRKLLNQKSHLNFKEFERSHQRHLKHLSMISKKHDRVPSTEYHHDSGTRSQLSSFRIPDSRGLLKLGTIHRSQKSLVASPVATRKPYSKYSTNQSMTQKPTGQVYSAYKNSMFNS